MKYLIISILILFTVELSAQEYVDFVSEDDISIEYKWRKKQVLKKGSPYVMYLKIYNSGIESAQVRFEMFYYKNATVFSNSGVMEYCIKPGQKIKGKKWDLVFQSDIKTMKEIDDRSFSWEIDLIKIDKNADCETGLRFSLEPKHELDCSELSDDQ